MDQLTTKSFSATVNGKRRSVLITLPASMAGDTEEGYAVMMGDDRYWNIFWGFDSYLNDEATAEDLCSTLEDMQLTKVRLS